MRFLKPALTFPDQADQLLKRGLAAPDKQAVIEKLQAVSYYRLSAYWYWTPLSVSKSPSALRLSISTRSSMVLSAISTVATCRG
jgi:abortive infection bacteriophage resistance protein